MDTRKPDRIISIVLRDGKIEILADSCEVYLVDADDNSYPLGECDFEVSYATGKGVITLLENKTCTEEQLTKLRTSDYKYFDIRCNDEQYGGLDIENVSVSSLETSVHNFSVPSTDKDTPYEPGSIWIDRICFDVTQDEQPKVCGDYSCGEDIIKQDE